MNNFERKLNEVLLEAVQQPQQQNREAEADEYGAIFHQGKTKINAKIKQFMQNMKATDTNFVSAGQNDPDRQKRNEYWKMMKNLASQMSTHGSNCGSYDPNYASEDNIKLDHAIAFYNQHIHNFQ